MPVFTSASLISSALSGLLHVAGKTADALSSANADSAKKSNSPDNTKEAAQLANLFAVYLAAASQVPPGSVARPVSPAPTATNMPVKGSSKSVNNASASSLPLTLMMAAGPTTALTAAAALHSAAIKGSGPTPTAKSASAAANAATEKTAPAAAALTPSAASANAPVVKAQTAAAILNLAASKGVQAGAAPAEAAVAPAKGPGVKAATPASGAAASVPGAKIVLPSAPAVAHPVAAKNAPTADKGKQGQSPRPSSVTDRTAATGTIPPSPEKTTEAPVLALYDVPTPIAHASTERAAVATAAPPERTESPRVQVAAADGEKPSARQESMPVPSVSPKVLLAQARTTALASNRDAPIAQKSPGSPAPSRNDSQSQAFPSLTANVQPGTSAPVAHTVGQTLAAAPAATGSAQPDAPVSEQLAQALVSHADLVNHDGRTDFHLRLDPPQLGGVQIHLTAADHTISARVVVSQEGTRQLIEGQAHHLRQSLADAGLVLHKFDVTHQGGGFADNGRRPPPELPLAPPVRLAAPAPVAVVTTNRIVPTGGIDILA